MRIVIAKIDPENRTVTTERLTFSPEAVQAMVCLKPAMAIIAQDGGADVIVVGDNYPQNPLLPARKPWVLKNANGLRSPVCRGVGFVCGFHQGANKATSLALPPEWVAERIEWDPVEESDDAAD
jgi:hypothetical protein